MKYQRMNEDAGNLSSLRPTIRTAAIYLFFVFGAIFSYGAESGTVVRQFDKTFTTYPYGDPDGVPNFSTRAYPYFRFDRFSADAEKKTWRVVELSNDLISVEILPDIGGKIWDAVDKKTGKSFIYANPVVKFRDIALRGPWTSGGLEMNVGIIGHTPNCSSPVSCVTRSNADKSVSCFIGSLDLLGRARWSVEITLPADRAAFSTRVRWTNLAGLATPYYSWFNLGVPAADDLHTIAPGTTRVDHDGSVAPWPIDTKTGKDLSYYKNNDFGSYKSYHTFGSRTEFFGAYYHDDDFGIATFVPPDAKLGRKVWIWGQSREGMIWEDLLTDPPGGQYVEIQTGRFFNQAYGTVKTPFKERPFVPYRAETWTEYWMPVRGIGGFNATSPDGAAFVRRDGDQLVVSVFPTVSFDGNVEIFDGGSRLYSQRVSFETGEPWEGRFDAPESERLRVDIGNGRIVWSNAALAETSRPKVNGNASESERLSDCWYQARTLSSARQYREADEKYNQCLVFDSAFVPAFVGLAENALCRGEFQAAFDFARRALEIDTYDGDANFVYGLAALRLKNRVDALDGFAAATLFGKDRFAAYYGLGQAQLWEGRYEEALDAFLSASKHNALAPTAVWGQAVALRKLDRIDELKTVTDAALQTDPLDFMARWEQWLAGWITDDDVLDALGDELPHESILEAAIAYAGCGLTDEAARILSLGLKKQGILKTEMLFHLAYYTENLDTLALAEKEPAAFCFPCRPESYEVFRWCADKSTGWKSDYVLAVLCRALDRKDECGAILARLADRPDEAVFYAFRGMESQDERSLADFRQAVTLDENSSRCAVLLAAELKKSGTKEEFLEQAKKSLERFPYHSALMSLYGEALMKNERFDDALEFFEGGVFLPSEGSVGIRTLYRQTAMELARRAIDAEQYDRALAMIEKAKSWPENLGSGRPYPDKINTDEEDELEALCREKISASAETRQN